jgi:hypothetical protein
LTSRPSNVTMTSPGWMPAGLAGLDGQTVGDIVGHLLDAHAEPAAPRLAELAQLIDHRHRGVGGDGKTDADRAARR